MVALSRFHKRLIGKEELIRHMCRVLLPVPVPVGKETMVSDPQDQHRNSDSDAAVKLEPVSSRHPGPAMVSLSRLFSRLLACLLAYSPDLEKGEFGRLARSLFLHLKTRRENNA